MDDHYELVVDFFGPLIQFPYQNGPEPTKGGAALKTLELRCVRDERYGSFGARIDLGVAMTRPSLSTIDRWCRAHLPTEFLTEYDASTVLGTRPGED